jgi:pteridine reductase
MNIMGIEKKIVLVTGGARRIGKAIALTLAKAGAFVVVHYHRSKREAEATLREIKRYGGAGDLVCGDIRLVEDCRKIVRETSRFGGVDILVNNASVFYETPFLKTTESDWNDLIETNLRSCFFLAQESVAIMMKKKVSRKSAVPKGKIIQISDWSAFKPYKGYIPYCISKAGVTALTQGLARTLAPDILVNAIAPGPIILPETFSRAARERVIRHIPLNRIGSPADIADAVLFLAQGGNFMTGQTIIIDGGQSIR